jgi:tRNA(fMet)-specific endonuclease VapC
MPAYMLDTDTVSFALRGEGRVGERLLTHRPSDVCVSSLTVAELKYGADLRRSRRLHRLIDGFVDAIEVPGFDRGAADRFGALGALLARRGVPIGALDTLIAAHASSLGLTLVTRNEKHFARVPGLRIENWF